MIDTSRSTVFNLADIQHAALAFVDQMRPSDRAVVVSFSDDFNVLTEATSDHETLRRAIEYSSGRWQSRSTMRSIH